MALELHDVRDAEQFARAIAARSNLRLSYHDTDDLHEYLLSELWVLSTRYNPGGTVSFSSWAGTILRLRCVDWQRKHYGRTKGQFSGGRSYTKDLPDVLSLDALDDEPGSELGRVEPGGSLDDGTHRLADELRSLDARGRRPAGRADELG